MIRREIAIVGAGAAGLAAALEATRYGAEVLVIDENARAGGQLFKQIHKFFGSQLHRAKERGMDIGRRLLEEAQEAGAEILLNTSVLGFYEPNSLALLRNDRVEELHAKRIILATGANEKAIAFPGWTLPGVMGAGAAQTMMNLYGVLPGRNILMIGSGNIGLIVSYQLLQAGAEVKAIVEAKPQIGGYGVHASKVRRAGVPIYVSHTIKEAKGGDEVEGAIIIALDDKGNHIPTSERELEIDTICLAVGLSPQVDLARMAGCEFIYIPELGGHIPIHDRNMETTSSGVYVAGDVAGIEEASTAMEEGRLAGISAATSLGYISSEESERLKGDILNRLEDLRAGPFGEVRRRVKRRISGIDEEIDIEGDLKSSSTLRTTGVLSPQDLSQAEGVPSIARLKRTAVAVLECIERIPCNPCQTACPKGAITVGDSIVNLPQLNEDVCDGCGRCIADCPGLAIFVVNMNYRKDEALIMLPYEYLPLPKVGERVKALNRKGEIIGEARVIRVRNTPRQDRTPIISIAVAKELGMEVRNIAPF